MINKQTRSMDVYKHLSGQSLLDEQSCSIQCVCYGFLRQNMNNIRIDDIATIVVHYVRPVPLSFIHHEVLTTISQVYKPNIFNDCLLNCKFQFLQPPTQLKNYQSIVLVTPFLSQMILSNDHRSQLMLNFKLSVPEIESIVYKNHVQNDNYYNCNQVDDMFDISNWDTGGKYKFQCGLIEIPKKAFLHSEWNTDSETKGDDDDHDINKSNDNINSKFGDDIGNINGFYDLIDIDGLNLSTKGLLRFNQFFTTRGFCFDDVRNTVMYQFMGRKCRYHGYYMSFSYQNGLHNVYYNSTDKVYTSFNYDGNYCLAVNDSVQLCVDYNIKKRDVILIDGADMHQHQSASNMNGKGKGKDDLKIEASCCFKIRNKQLTTEAARNTLAFFDGNEKDGIVDLDFEKNYYFVAFSNTVANMNCHTYTFQVSRSYR